MRNIPKKIYLNINTGGVDVSDFNELSQVTWSTERVNDTDIEYDLNTEIQQPDNGSSENIAKLIKELIGNYFLNGTDYSQHNRKREFSEPRHWYYYFTKKYTKLSLQKIGRIMNSEHPFNHATILHGIRNITNLIETNRDKSLAHDILDFKIRQLIKMKKLCGIEG